MHKILVSSDNGKAWGKVFENEDMDKILDETQPWLLNGYIVKLEIDKEE